MSSLAHDNTVTVQSFEDHLGFPLNAFDDIKLDDVIIAWCSQSGESRVTLTPSPLTTWCPGWTLRPGDPDLTKIFGTCEASVVDPVTPGWVWRDEDGEELDITRFNSSHLSSCGETFSNIEI